MRRLTSHGIASLGPEETKSQRVSGTGSTSATPTKRMEGRGKSKATELDFPTFTERIRDAARGGGADAFGTVYEHYKPLLADHAAAEALGRFANLMHRSARDCARRWRARAWWRRSQEPKANSDRYKLAQRSGDSWELHWQHTTGKLETNSGAAGMELMGHTMQALMEARSVLAWLQLDCTNAFGELSREKCLQALHNKMPHLLAFEAQWLTQPSRAISRDEKGDTVEFRITAGLDQGDPFSPVAFAATLGELQNAILQAQRVAGIGRAVSGCFSFLDDLTLALPHMAAENARQLAREKLAAVGLRLNMTKCMIYTPSQVAPPGMEDWWEQTKRHDGLIIAGRPYSIEEESLKTNFEGVGTVFPEGENKFLEDFAETVKTKIVTALGTTNGESTSGTAGETSGKRVTKAAHLLRMLPPHSTGELANTADKHTIRSFARINNINEELEKNSEILSLPISEGGVGLKRLNWMKEGAREASWLQNEWMIGAAVHHLRNWKEAALPCQQAVKLAHSNMVDKEGVDAIKIAGTSWETLHLSCRTMLQKAVAL